MNIGISLHFGRGSGRPVGGVGGGPRFKAPESREPGGGRGRRCGAAGLPSLAPTEARARRCPELAR